MKKNWVVLLVVGILLVASGSGALLTLGLRPVPLIAMGLGLALLLGAVLITLGGGSESEAD